MARRFPLARLKNHLHTSVSARSVRLHCLSLQRCREVPALALVVAGLAAVEALHLCPCLFLSCCLCPHRGDRSRVSRTKVVDRLLASQVLRRQAPLLEIKVASELSVTQALLL